MIKELCLYKLRLQTIIFLCLIIYTFILPQTIFAERWEIHERRISNSLWTRQEGFNKLPEHLINLKFGLKQSNLHTLYDELLKVSEPGQATYGYHWSPERVIQHFSPSQEAIEEVYQWLHNSTGGRKPLVSHARNWLNIQLTLSEVEKLLETKYYNYVNQETGRIHIACEDYKLPSRLSKHIDIVLPTVHFDVSPTVNRLQQTVPFSKKSRIIDPEATEFFNAPTINPVPGAARRIGNPNSGNIPQYAGHINHTQVEELKKGLKNCGKFITLNCLRALYKFGNYKIKNKSFKNSLAIVEFTPQTVIFDDMDIFFSNFSRTSKGSRPELVSIDGGAINQDNRDFGLNGESNLDLQYSMPFVFPLNVSLYQVGDSLIGGSFNNFLDALDSSYCSGPLDPFQDAIYPNPGGYGKRDCGTIKPAKIISTSYGMNEADATPAYLQRQCNEYGKLGLMGTTFVFSSGDNGVAGNRGVCLNHDGTQSAEGALFNPSFPGTCPYVTSIGATQLPEGRNVNDPEVACYTRIHSGGGFSNVFKMPGYQAESVKKYFAQNPPVYDQKQFNNSRRTRGFPDLSANGANFVVAVDGKFGLVYGTSASAPVVASLLTMINDARSAVGKNPIGFINPVIYSKKFREAFRDIINGTNPGCGTHGFSAVPGWDPVTGLGTPDFSKLLPLWTKI